MVNAYWMAVEKCKVGEMYLIGSRWNYVHTSASAWDADQHVQSQKITYKTDPQYVRPTQSLG